MKFSTRKYGRVWVMITLLLLSVATVLFGQDYQNGIRNGIVKVKFASGMTHSLATMNMRTTGDKLVTGIQSFDAVSTRHNARAMTRLFPQNPNPLLEAKLKKHGLDLWYVIEVDPNEDPKQIALAYQVLGEVAVAEVEKQKSLAPFKVQEHSGGVRPFGTSNFNDPYLVDQWHYNNTGQTGFAGGADINLFDAWTITAGSRDVIVSIHDQGVDVNHPDLKANMWVNEAELNGIEGVDDDGNGFIDDIHGWNFDKKTGKIDPEFHGTHVAGTIAAVNNNGIGVAGVAGGTGNNDGARIMSLQALGGGSLENTFIYAANNGAVISQNSWGYNEPGIYDQSILDAMDYFIEEAGDYPGSPMKGGIVIFAAGNSNWDANWYPGVYQNAMAVSAIGPDWKKASYSNFGTWVDIAAPGGEVSLGAKNGVLSTLPNAKIGYLEGTSMACPHVSGVAALVLANRTSQLTPAVLWNKLLTGVVDIDAANEDYTGKLGSGHLDAFLAIQNDAGIAPNAIENLTVVGIAQEFATLSWSVPADEDDVRPVDFRILIHTDSITVGNMLDARQEIITNKSEVGTTINFSVEGLLGLTKYYFAVVSGDRWNNLSELSNVATGTTNEGPAIAVDEDSQEIILDIDVSASTMGSHDITILNNAEGLLRWEYFMRHKKTELSPSSFQGLRYPKLATGKVANLAKVGTQALRDMKPNSGIGVTAFQEQEKSYIEYTSYIIGENDLSLTNSSATKFFVNEEEGFNLTRVVMYLKHKPDLGPVIVEIYKGQSINKQALIHAQEYVADGNYEHNAYINLTEQQYFQKGETFWIVFHVPAGNKYPLGVGWEKSPENSDYCFMSVDMGKTWAPLAELMADKNFAWSTVAVSTNEYLGEYIILEPASGEIAGMEEGATTLTADATSLINGTYQANVVLASNDANQRALRIPVTINVSGHLPKLSSIETLDFSGVFQGTSKEMSVTIRNSGLGNYNDIEYSISNPKFEIQGWPSTQIAAKGETTLTIRYNPTAEGNDNGLLTLSSASSNKTLKIILFGISSPPAAIAVAPLTQTINAITIGDQVNASITVENTGQAALKYFVPGFDESGVAESWTEDYHNYGYKFRTSYANEPNPLVYNFQDITTTGENITPYFKANDNRYFPVEMGFTFPYYKDNMSTLYVSVKGFTTFSDAVNPINTPRLDGAPWSPQGYISPLGQFVDLSAGGDVFYRVEPDRVIVQWNEIGDAWSGFNTAQMVLYADGNIRFFYENIGYYNTDYLTVLIEDFDQQDGILVHDWSKPISIYSGLAVGFDYPGPNIITSITNAGGILMPGESAELEVAINTSTLAEGIVNRYVNIISNDPFNGQEIALVQLNVVAGGEADIVLSSTDINFGEVFQGAVAKRNLSFKNNGTASVMFTSFTQDNSTFIINGNQSATVKPGLGVVFEVEMPTEVVTTLSDVIRIGDDKGNEYVINLSGIVLDPPAIVTDLSPIIETLAHGEKSSHPISFENTGLADLEVVATGTQWLTMKKNIGPMSTPAFTYTYKMYNDGTNYQWLDIRKTGTQLPFIGEDYFDPEQYWRTLELPWPVNFYGQEYTTMYVAENGLITFTKPEEIPFFTERFPTETNYKMMLAPYWTFGGIDNYVYPDDEVGIFVKTDDEKIIISWEYLQDNFGGLADPMSAQIIFYTNGTMKFQYKVNGSSDAMSRTTNIGMQNEDGSDYVTINAYSNLPHGSGLAYIVSPAEKHTVAPGTTMNATIEINTVNIFAGTYEDALIIRTNVPGSEQMEKPVQLTVTGEAAITTLDTLNFGTILAFETVEGPAAYNREFTITNSGVAELFFISMNVESLSPDFAIEMWAYDPMWGGSWYWSDIAWIWEWPVVKPGEGLKFRLVYRPTEAGALADNVVLNTSLGELLIPVKGTVTKPPVLGITTARVSSEVTHLTDTDSQIATINNFDGEGELTYELSIAYHRSASNVSTSSQEQMANAPGTAPLKTIAATTGSISPSSIQSFNRVLSHEERTSPDDFLGYSGAYDLTVSTKFNAGSDGFNISHIQVYYRSIEKATGVLEYQVRAGGSNIANAKVLTSGTYTYTYTAGQTGEWLDIPIENPQTIFPNEDFYVVVTYPFDLEYPQGIVSDLATASADRYNYLYEGVWYDIQDNFETTGWMMRAAEETFVSNTWVAINGATSGTIAIGDSLNIQLDFTAAYGERGDQHATLIITSNDPMNPTGSIPVTLHINEGPRFTGVPAITRMDEGTTKAIVVKVKDVEGHTFTLAPAAAYTGVTHALVEDNLTITLAPDYDAAGEHAYVFMGTDEHGAVSQMTLNVLVKNVNRAPVFVGATEALHYYDMGELIEYPMGDFFSDPDGDKLSFVSAMSNPEVATVFGSASSFIIKPLMIGTSELNVVVTDTYGASLSKTLTITVDKVLGFEDSMFKGVKAYPNPMENTLTVTMSSEWNGVTDIHLMDVTGKKLITNQVDMQRSREVQLKVGHLQTGVYILQVVGPTGRSVIKVVKE